MSKETVSIDRQRLEHLSRAIELVTMGAFQDAGQALQDAGDDALTPVVRSLGIFVDELRRSVETKEQVLAELQVSQAELQDALETVQRQQLAIQDLGTPIVDVWDDVIALPVVGVIDTQRALAMTEKLLTRISDARAKCVIIDLTGVDLVDSKTAEYLINMTRAANMLGSFCVITGIGPEIAQTLVTLGVELGAVKTLRNLKEGLRTCFAYLRAQNKLEAGPSSL